MNHEHTEAAAPEPLSKRVVALIERERLAPRPRSYFVLIDWLFWAFGAVAVLLSAATFAAALFEILSVGWRYHSATHADFLSFFVSVVPVLWIVVLALFAFLGYENVRRTKKGYRYPLPLLVLGAVLASVALGTVLYAAGVGEAVEQGIGDHPPFYRPIAFVERDWWLRPELGLLAGEVRAEASGRASFTLEDFSGRVWTVDAADLRPPDLAVLAGGRVRVVGVPTTTPALFHACFVFPWRGVSVALPQPHFSERTRPPERSPLCRGIRPYGSLRALEGE